jgi:hypothetical protein
VKVIRRAGPERLTELARGIVRGEYLVADTSRDWLHSLMMMGEAIANTRNCGLVLVPVDAHLGSTWLNGRVPGVTITCVLVAKGDVADLQRRVDRMNTALYPEN